MSAESASHGLLLADPTAVRELAAANARFAAFLGQAVYDSGPRVGAIQAQQASYRVTLAEGMVHYDLNYFSRLGNAEASPTVADLVQPTLDCPVESLIHGIWESKSFAALQSLLTDLRAVVRFVRGEAGEWRGYVLMSAHLNRLLELLARGQRVNSNGESTLDAITRNLGLRNKVRELVEQSGNSAPVEYELTDTGLARTLVQNWRR